MTSPSLTVTTRDGLKMDAYVAYPESGKGPGLIIIQEIFGVNSFVRNTADYYARNGFLAVAPDLFHRLEPNIQITDQTEAEWQKAFSLYQRFDENLGAEDLKDTVDTVRKLPACQGKVGTLGFCLGGKLAFLCATRSSADANVGYYGVGIENNLNEVVKQPLLLHIAEEDSYVNKEMQKKIREKLNDNSMVSIYSYPGQNHAFSRDGGQHYNKEAADLAHDRSLEFLKKHLG